MSAYPRNRLGSNKFIGKLKGAFPKSSTTKNPNGHLKFGISAKRILKTTNSDQFSYENSDGASP